MNNSRTLNSKRNIVWGIINKFVQLVFPFIIRTIIIYKLGVEYVGLNSLFSSILSTLSLAELGFGNAIVTIMYRSVAENDYTAINALLKFIKRAYFIIGSIILVSGVLCMPFLYRLIDDTSNIPADINIYFLFLLFLVNTIISYYFGGYRVCLLDAYQRQDITNKITIAIYFLISIIQIVLLMLFKNYYIYVFLIILSTLLINISIYCWSKKKYSFLFPEGSINPIEKKQLKKIVIGTFYGRIGSVLSVSFDNIVISTFLGLTILGYYSNYSYILNAIQAFLMIIYASMQASIGNSLTLESVEKNYNDMMKFTFIFKWLVGWCAICLLYLYNPFIELWIGKVGLLPDLVVISIVVYFYVTICCGVIGTYKAAARIWWEDRFRCIIGGIVNLALNIFSVLILKDISFTLALLGVVISTILSYVFIQIPWSIWITFKLYFKNGLKQYIILSLEYVIVTIIVALICFPIMNVLDINSFDPIIVLIYRGLLLLIIPNIIYFVCFYKSHFFKPAFDFITKKIVRNKI